MSFRNVACFIEFRDFSLQFLFYLDHLQCVIYQSLIILFQGLDLAIALMEVGETAAIEVASRFAYGDTGLPPDIPPGATLLYTIELKAMRTETEIEELDFHKRKKIGYVAGKLLFTNVTNFLYIPLKLCPKHFYKM